MFLEGTIECGVRRIYYPVSSPGGRGARWEWARAGPAQSRWETLPMESQCLLEEAWSAGAREADLSPWLVDFCTMTAAGPGGARKTVRRIHQAPYPLIKVPSNHTNSDVPPNIQGNNIKFVSD